MLKFGKAIEHWNGIECVWQYAVVEWLLLGDGRLVVGAIVRRGKHIVLNCWRLPQLVSGGCLRAIFLFVLGALVAEVGAAAGFRRRVGRLHGLVA